MVAAGAFAEEDGRYVTREGDIAGRGRCEGTEEYGGEDDSGNQHRQPFSIIRFSHGRGLMVLDIYFTNLLPLSMALE